MQITHHTVNNLGYISITIMMAMLLLLWFGIVPQSFTVPFLIIAMVMFVARVILRIKLAKMERETQRRLQNEQADSPRGR